MPKRSCGPAACLLLVLLPACDPGAMRPAHGEASSLIVVAADSLWAEVGEQVIDALERPIFAVRDERTFEVTHVSPFSEDWLELRRFRQVVPIGQAGDGWVEPVLSGDPPTAGLPAIVEAQDVWAREQGVTALVVPAGAGAEAVARALPALADTLHARFRQYALNRMYLSGVDSAGRDSLQAVAGFSLLLPELYRAERRDSTWVFRAHAELGAELMRTILVTWRPGRIGAVDPAALPALRDTLAVYNPSQVSQAEPLRADTVAFAGGRALQVRGVWSGDDPSFPSAGPFMTRIAYCPDQDRSYLIDAWLYAPRRQKHEYLLQLDHILDSFRCEGTATVPGSGA